MKTILYCPGFQGREDDVYHKEFFELARQKGYNIKYVSINWKRTTINNWVDQLEQEILKYNLQDLILAGLSFGAMTSFLAATKNNVSELWLLSLSPFFSDSKFVTHPSKIDLRQVGRKRLNAFKSLNFVNLAQQIKPPTKVFCGSNELPETITQARLVNKFIRNSELFVAKDAKHSLLDEKYLQAIAGNI